MTSYVITDSQNNVLANKRTSFYLDGTLRQAKLVAHRMFMLPKTRKNVYIVAANETHVIPYNEVKGYYDWWVKQSPKVLDDTIQYCQGVLADIDESLLCDKPEPSRLLRVTSSFAEEIEFNWGGTYG